MRAALRWFGELPGTLRGIGLILLAGLMGTAMMTLVRLLGADLHPFEINFFRTVFSLLMLAPVVLRRGLRHLRTPRLGLHMLRGLINGCAQLSFFMALVMIPLAQISALSFTAPLFTTVTAVVVLGEVIRVRRITALAVGIAGTWLILRPGVVDVELGSILALCGALGWGVTMIVVKIISRTDSAIGITFYGALFIAPIALIAAIPFWRTPTLVELAWLAAIAVFATLVHLCFNQAIKEADLTVLLPFDFTRLIWAAIVGYLIFAEAPSIWTWVGGAMIFTAGTYLAIREGRPRGARDAVPPPGA
ncbi:MAG: DMT family transporter [Rhodospirillales bacterium]|nr:DMT family transporter [Rhodospirillales bacterium]MDP6803741.1 DMT family transporter [Rhodospirillales bacterium]